MSTKRIRVMIVEDSDVARELLEHVIGNDERLEVAASVASGEAALQVLEKVKPDVISLDIRLPGINGFEVTRQVMRTRPTPVVVVSCSLLDSDLQITMNALKAGALTVIEKPRAPTHANYEALAARLCTQLSIMSHVRVVRQRSMAPASEATTRAREPVLPTSTMPPSGHRAVGIVASTGGPNAVSALLRDLGGNFPHAVLLVQHMTPTFMPGFIRWLGTTVPQHVCEARAGDPLVPGTVHVAPADVHTTLSPDGRIRHSREAPIHHQRPSGSLMLRSLAETFGRWSVGVVLTGMGRDGADGLLAIHQAGGYTLTEDESTCVVYGMPAAAAQLGAVKEMLPLPDIAARVREVAAGARQ